MLRAISIYTGVGGLDFGFEAAGFETKVALDLDPVACRTVRLNRNWPVIEGDISGISSDAILSAAGLREAEADVLIGGPPCQPFSKSGYWATGDARRLGDPRAGTLGQYLRVLRDTLPRVFLMENVAGLAYAGKSEGLELFQEGVDQINCETGANYRLATQAVNAADFGVPQSRERVVIVGVRDGKQFKFPEPRFGQGGAEPHRTAWDALGDLPQINDDPSLRMTGKWADLMPAIPEGENYLWHTPRGGGSPLFGWRTRYWNFMLKLAKDQPSWTLQAQPGPATGPFHWCNRRLSASELARLQTLPDGLRFECGRADAQRLIGNAVPSALAEALAREIRRQIFGQSPHYAPSNLVPKRRGKPPAPEPVRPVPAKFLALCGDHEAHPGTGKGRRAVGRMQEAA